MKLLRSFVLFIGVVGLVSSTHASVIAHWRFEEGTANSIAAGPDVLLDSSGNSLDMTPLGGPIYRSVPNPGSALGLDFDGANDIASRADSSLFQLQSLTVEAFIRLDDGASLRQIFFRGDSRGGKDPVYLAVLNGRLRFNLSNLSADQILDTVPLLPTGVFIHVAGTLDHSTDTMKVFVNGAEIGSKSAAGVRPNVALFPNARVSIGGLADGLSIGQHFNGIIDEVRISDTALAPSQFLGSSVPEPSSFALMGLSLIGIAGYNWRRKRKAT